jgi:hypothetical protein
VSTTPSSSTGERVTFRQLFERHPFVDIPIIQRDYVQGRPSQLEVRTEFLRALHEALSKPKEDPTLPLDLDFVYGTIEGKERKSFSPLDGQQRLTTLFLLHWYLAWKDGQANHFLEFIKSGETSRFSYTVRPSSHEFFNALLNWHPEHFPSPARSLPDFIEDQSWFFRSWKLDPTIQAALSMLDALHALFYDAKGFYDRLVTTDHPYVTFQLLDLRAFGLSDDLYIKMNARGKPLTTFENFKAKLEQLLDALFPSEQYNLHGKPASVKNYFSHRIDTVWADLFWEYRDPQTALFDTRIMNLIRTVVIVTRDPAKAGIDSVLRDLRSTSVSFSFLKYQEHQCLDRPLLETLITLLDEWSGGVQGIKTHLTDSVYFDERRVFEKIIKDCLDLTYDELVQFHAYSAFLNKHHGQIPPDRFWDWMRVINNLTINTPYDGLDDFKRSIRAINALLNDSHRILDFLSSTAADVQGFNEQQIREEKLKAQLIRRSDEWRSLILQSEQHPYFRGQIEFLFKFSGVLDRWAPNGLADWTSAEDMAYQTQFADYFVKAATVFSAKGLNDFGQYRWERALLSIGNYLLRKGRNYSFLTDSDRDASWKRLLRGGIRADDPIEVKRQYVKDLLDLIDLNIGTAISLDSVIARAGKVDEWRRLIVTTHELVGYCSNRMVRWESPDCVYLLTKVRMSGEHAELFTYHLKIGLLSEKKSKGELAPFNGLYYRSVATDSQEPHVRMQCSGFGGVITLDIFNTTSAYNLHLHFSNGELPSILTAGLTKTEDFKGDLAGALLTKSVVRQNIEGAIDAIVTMIRSNLPLPAA